jgi:hypothetical protein
MKQENKQQAKARKAEDGSDTRLRNPALNNTAVAVDLLKMHITITIFLLHENIVSFASTASLCLS